jgi:type IV pilus assembly protein PilP
MLKFGINKDPFSMVSVTSKNYFLVKVQKYGGVIMKRHFQIFCCALSLVLFSTFLFGPVCYAKSSEKPIIIRKKIVEQTTAAKTHKTNSEIESDLNIDFLRPKSDVSIVTSKFLPPPYNPKGKENPFKPLFRETPKRKPKPPTPVDTERKHKTALEKIDLSQLRLTGIILAASGNKALVQEASGRGYVISKGTYIGTQGGRVSAVLKDRVIIDEMMKDDMEKVFIQKTEMKINSKS